MFILKLLSNIFQSNFNRFPDFDTNYDFCLNRPPTPIFWDFMIVFSPISRTPLRHESWWSSISVQEICLSFKFYSILNFLFNISGVISNTDKNIFYTMNFHPSSTSITIYWWLSSPVYTLYIRLESFFSTPVLGRKWI